MATGTIKKQPSRNGWMEWSDVTVSSGSWKTNTGATGTGVAPSGGSNSNAYNLWLDIPGKYLVTAYATFLTTSTSGLRGIRLYKSESSVGEYFTAPTSNYIQVTASRIVESNGSDNVRMGLFQSSGSTVTATDIFVTATYLG